MALELWEVHYNNNKQELSLGNKIGGNMTLCYQWNNYTTLLLLAGSCPEQRIL